MKSTGKDEYTKTHDENSNENNAPTITILCALPDSIYKEIPGLDVWDKERNAYNYKGTNPIIAHPPCAQWSKLRKFAYENTEERELGILCIQLVKHYGGIVEQPQGSILFEHCNVPRNKIYSINQNWFGYPGKKTTWLYFEKYKPLPMPLSLDIIPSKPVQYMNSKNGERSRTTKKLAEWLINSILLYHEQQTTK